METIKYIHHFIDLNINKHIPDKNDPFLHINPRFEIKNILLKLIDKWGDNIFSTHLSQIKYIIINYKEILYKRFSKLN